MQQDPSFLRKLLKYDVPGPRYTSYPTVPVWKTDFHEKDYVGIIGERQGLSEGVPLSLYVHVPYCETQCYFCGCNAVANPTRRGVGDYIHALESEICRIAAVYQRKGPLVQVHFGGGSPNYLTEREMDAVWTAIEAHFEVLPDAEVSIEIDPRAATPDQLAYLRDRGFNRMSFGVQDFNVDVQRTIGRIQPFELTRNVFDACRRLQFDSINIDLVYGLPKQDARSFVETLARINELKPDRIAVFNYAHLPQLRPFQRRFRESDLPAPDEKLKIFLATHDNFLKQGYVQVGMDHFAKPNDELCRAMKERSLHRNFQGYTTKAGCRLLGIGATAISDLGDCYAQNEKRLPAYVEQAGRGSLPIVRGMRLSEEDVLRRAVIHTLMCHFFLDKTAIEERYSINFDAYFRTEIGRLAAFVEDRMVELDGKAIRVLDAGKLVIRNMCMVFDAYLTGKDGAVFSRTV